MELLHDTAADERAGKVPAVTLGFWIIKILATTLGETGGDAVTMSMKLGYAVGTAPSTCRATGLIGAAARPRVHSAMPSSAISRHAIIASERSAR